MSFKIWSIFLIWNFYIENHFYKIVLRLDGNIWVIELHSWRSFLLPIFACKSYAIRMANCLFFRQFSKVFIIFNGKFSFFYFNNSSSRSYSTSTYMHSSTKKNLCIQCICHIMKFGRHRLLFFYIFSHILMQNNLYLKW